MRRLQAGHPAAARCVQGTRHLRLAQLAREHHHVDIDTISPIVRFTVFAPAALAGVVAPVAHKDGGASLRVAGGDNAADGQLPWMAVITMDRTAMCGGSVISETFILTSAQCASGYGVVSLPPMNLSFQYCVG